MIDILVGVVDIIVVGMAMDKGIGVGVVRGLWGCCLMSRRTIDMCEENKGISIFNFINREESLQRKLEGEIYLEMNLIRL